MVGISMVRVMAVRHASMSVLNDYYTTLFGIDRRELWQAVTARPHDERLEDYEGFYVA